MLRKHDEEIQDCVLKEETNTRGHSVGKIWTSEAFETSLHYFQVCVTVKQMQCFCLHFVTECVV